MFVALGKERRSYCSDVANMLTQTMAACVSAVLNCSHTSQKCFLRVKFVLLETDWIAELKAQILSHEVRCFVVMSVAVHA